MTVIEKLAEYIVRTLVEFGFEPEDIKIKEKVASNGEVSLKIFLRKYEDGKPLPDAFVSKEIPVEIQTDLVVVKDTNGKPTFKMSSPSTVVDESELSSLMEEAGVKKFNIDGKYVVSSVSFDKAVSILASFVSYPYRTKEGVVLHNHLQFLNYFKNLKSKKSSVEFVNPNVDEVEVSPDLVKDEDDMSIVEDEFLVDTVSQIASYKMESLNDKFEEAYGEVLKDIVSDKDVEDYIREKKQQKVSSIVKLSIMNKLDEWGLDKRDYNLEVVATEKSDNEFDVTIKYDDGENSLESYGVVFANELTGTMGLSSSFVERLAGLLEVKEYRIDDLGIKFESISSEHFMKKLESYYPDVAHQIMKGEKKPEIKKIISSNPDAEVSYWEFAVDENGNYVLVKKQGKVSESI